MLILTIFFSICPTLAFCHPVHVSITNMDIKTTEKLIEFSIKVFTNDIESAVVRKYKTEISICDTIKHKDLSLVLKYINSTFQIYLNSQKLPISFVDKKISDNYFLLYFKIDLEKKDRYGIKLTNSLLMDTFPDQQNLVIVNLNGDEKGYSLTRKDHEIEF